MPSASHRFSPSKRTQGENLETSKGDKANTIVTSVLKPEECGQQSNDGAHRGTLQTGDGRKDRCTLLRMIPQKRQRELSRLSASIWKANKYLCLIENEFVQSFLQTHYVEIT